jgi:anti-sigma regulatory factor (Ser/Thr protein kinase)
MDTMMPTRSAVKHSRSVSLNAGPAAAAQARSLVQAAIRDWDVPVDPPTAALLTSELVTNAIRHGHGRTIMIVISCDRDQFRVDVQDASRCEPVQEDAWAYAETGRGLMLVSHLSTDWGYYLTLKGKVVYFALEYQLDGDDEEQGAQRDRDDHGAPGER